MYEDLLCNEEEEEEKTTETCHERIRKHSIQVRSWKTKLLSATTQHINNTKYAPEQINQAENRSNKPLTEQ